MSECVENRRVADVFFDFEGLLCLSCCCVLLLLLVPCVPLLLLCEAKKKLSWYGGARAKRVAAQRQAPCTAQQRTRGRASVSGAHCSGRSSGSVACSTPARRHLSGMLLYMHEFYCTLTSAVDTNTKSHDVRKCKGHLVININIQTILYNSSRVSELCSKKSTTSLHSRRDHVGWLLLSAAQSRAAEQ